MTVFLGDDKLSPIGKGHAANAAQNRGLADDRTAADTLAVANVLQPSDRNLLVAGIRGTVIASVEFLVNQGPAKKYHRAAVRPRKIWVADSVAAQMAAQVNLLRTALDGTPWTLHVGEPKSQQQTYIVGSSAELKNSKSCFTMRGFAHQVRGDRCRCLLSLRGGMPAEGELEGPCCKMRFVAGGWQLFGG